MRHLLSTQLRSLSYLFQERDQKLIELVGNLTFAQVKEDSDVEKAFNRIKEEVLLVPVTFQEPELTGDRPLQRQSQGDYFNLFPHTKNLVVADVTFPFTGSPELFSHSPVGNNTRLEGTRFYQPDFDSITIEVELNQLDRDIAFGKARQDMSGTFSLIKQINTEVTAWSATKETMIKAAIQKRRAELIKAYGR